jgi:hypothetical protein
MSHPFDGGNDGIHHGTNPHPTTGAYLFPQATERHVVKVFVPGLIRSDVAFLDRVLGTVREWREQAVSVERLLEITGDATPGLPAPLNWWAQTFGLIRDLAIRRYAAHILSYQNVLDDPEKVIREVVGWIGEGDAEKALSVVRPGERTVSAQIGTELGLSAGLDRHQIAVFDELYDTIHRGRDLTDPFVERLNEIDRELRPHFLADELARKRSAAEALLAGLTPEAAGKGPALAKFQPA